MSRQPLIDKKHMRFNIGALLQPGDQMRETKEKIADGILAFPRALWIGKHARLNGSKAEVDDIMSYASVTGCFWSDMPASIAGGPFLIFALANTAVFASVSVLASVLLLVGLPLKKSALKNPKASAYNNMVDAILRSYPIIKDIEKLQEVVETEQKLLETAQTEYNSLTLTQGSKHVELLIEKEKLRITDIINQHKQRLRGYKDEIDLLQKELDKLPSMSEAISRYKSMC